ncbi:MAG: hypothetical protein CMD99_00410 [Gammaproteobacteria bacterium]|nr:hypothetical protein [Gammaproteobacteria bacterium]
MQAYFLKLTAFIDGGGTKTRVRLVEHLTGAIVEEVVTGPANLGLGCDACWNQIKRAIDLARLDLPTRCVVGLAGTEYRKERQQFLASAPHPTVLVSDRDAGLFGAHSGRPGGCLTVGTGVSFAWLNSSGVVTRRGGFGFILGDQGGGAWMGQRLLCELIRLADQGDLLPSHINLIESLEIGPTANDWIAFANQATPRDFGSLAPSVLNTKSSIPISANIVTEGVSELDSLISGFPKTLPLALVGGLAHAYENHLEVLGYEVVTADGNALDGLSYIDQHLTTLSIDRWKSDD